MSRVRNMLFLFMLLSIASWATPVDAASDTGSVLQTWQMLDYMAADYPGAVKDGKVIDAAEYKEMREFAATAARRIDALVATPATPKLRTGSRGLITAIDGKASAQEVARWDLAFYVGTLAYAGDAAAGAQVWQDNPAARAQIAGLKDLTHARVAQLAGSMGADHARALLGYLRGHPDVVAEGLSGLLGGIAAGVVVLGAIAWIVMRTSRRLPIGTFFKASSALIAILAVVLTGKGIAALQEAGWLGVTLAPVPQVDVPGIYPSWQPLLAQLIVIALLVGGFGLNTLRGRHALAVGTP